MFTLIIEDKHGALIGEYSFEEGEFIIGRSQQADIQLSADNVSRRHARVFTQDGRCYIEDLKAANGVWVNGRRIHAVTELPRSAQVRIGDFFLHIEGAAFARPMTSPVYARLLPMPGSIGELTELTQPTVLIGRGKDCAVVLQDVSVSRIHAKITQDDAGRVVVEDLRSSNGTYVNDRRVDLQELGHGDRIRFGTVAFSFQVEGLPELDVADLDPPPVAAPSRRAAAPYAPRSHQAFAPVEHPVEQSYAAPQRTLLPQIAAVAVILVALVALVVLVGVAYDRFVAPRLDGKADRAADAGEKKAEAKRKSSKAEDRGEPAEEKADDREAAPPSRPKAVDRATQAAQYDDLVARGRDAVLRKQWAEAKGFFSKARTLDVAAAEPKENLNNIALEERAGADIAQAEEAFKRRDFRAAIRYHKQVPSASVYGADAQRSLQSLAQLADEQRVQSCRGKTKDLAKCLQDCELVLSTGYAGAAIQEECTRISAQGFGAGSKKR